MTEQQPDTFPPATDSANVATPPTVEPPGLSIGVDQKGGNVVLLVTAPQASGDTLRISFPLSPREAGNLAATLVQHAMALGGPRVVPRLERPGLVLPGQAAQNTLKLRPRS